MAVRTIRDRLLRLSALAVIAGVVLSGCSAVRDRSTRAMEPGVTSDPCPNAVDSRKGCIYLGVLSDLTSGPFAALGKDIHNGQLAFWKAVNEAGGIGGKYEVDITTYTEDTAYDLQKHAEAYERVEPHVLALSMSLGTVQTQRVLARMDAANMVAIAGTLWSGWQFENSDKGLLLESGYSYCSEAIIALDWIAEHQAKPSSLATVSYQGDYGGDYSTGAKKWASANRVDVVAQIDTEPNTRIGNQDAAVAKILAAKADLVLLATGPAEAGEIMGKAALAGYHGRFLGSGPTWNGGLLKSPAATAITARYNMTSPLDGWDGVSAGAKKARASATREPSTWGYSAGWMFSYPMKALLTRAVVEGKLTRRGVRQSVQGLRVDYEGAIPEYTYGAPKPDLSRQRAIIEVPDQTAPLGAKTLASGYHGPTQDRITLTEPCVQP
ncbi:ABC transporter substrate-binding protein [Nocardia sp. NBC_00508]|uniref:ABC transporter substrate-binding protein n=1 Tax=Nocardia sp. NBC_00508 TaxID=2975992 RepID=UPI002E818167|nr:ABC transporter substrate-binding protein [Nocardia sp. NBC_00508]WUD64640.1 ABC transporter substrate-binding protein [Nocardia sp. NBC_00508]